jgi:PAS domain S-box-containing protein
VEEPIFDRGKTTWFETFKTPIRDVKGDVIGTTGYSRDITERKLAEKVLRESEDRYRDLVENSQDLICTHDMEGCLLTINPAAARLLGYDLKEIISSNVCDYLVPEVREHFKHYISRLAQDGAASGLLFMQTKSGERRIWEYDNSVRTEGVAEPIVRGMARDVTERKQAEEKLAASEAKLRALFAAMRDVVLIIDANGIYREIAPTDPALLYSPPEELLGKSLADVFPAHEADQFLLVIREVLASQQLKQIEYQLLIGEALYWFSTNITPMSADLTVWVAHDITNRKQHERELEANAVVSAALRAVGSHAEMLPVILDQLTHLLQADTAAFAMRDMVTGETVLEAARGEFGVGLRARLPAGEGVSGQVIKSGKPYVNNNFQNESRFIRSDIMGDTTAAACVPLIIGAEIIGVIWIGRKTPLSNSDVHLLTAIAEIAASAIHRSTLHEEAKKQLERLAALRTIDVVIGSSFDLQVTLNIFLNQVLSQLHADAAAVLSHNTTTHVLEYVAGRGFKISGIEKTRLRLGEGHAGRAALERQTIYIPDLARQPLIRTNLAAEKFASYYAVPLIVKGDVKGLLEVFHRTPFKADDSWLDFLETLAGQAAIAMDNAALFENLQRTNNELALAYDATIEGWSRALDLRDKETEGHTQRVTEMTLRLAKTMDISETGSMHIRRGALLHDIGKMGIPDSILLKPGPLSDDEWAIMKQHPQYAYEMLSSVPFLKAALDIPYCHHEKWDGTGYPRGLKGEQIPLAARLFAIVDVWDALRSDRPYRQAWNKEKVRDYILEQSGKHFDPQVVEAFLRMIEKTLRNV